MIANLCKIKIIRNFLSLYKEDCWEKLICNMVEYGIILLKKKKNISAMSSDDIINFVEDFKRTEGLISPMNNINNYKKSSNSKSKKLKNNSFLDKSITSNYSSKSSKSVNKKRNYSVKPKSKSKKQFLKRNESFSYKKTVKKAKKINKSFSGSENTMNKNNNYTRIKIDSKRELTNTNYNSKKNENFGGQQALKDSFNSLSSKDTFFTNKKNNNYNNYTSNKNSSKKSFQSNNAENFNFKKNINNNDLYTNKQITSPNTNINTNTNNNINKKNNNKKKKKGNNGPKTRTIKIESKIKDLIQKDKNNFINTGVNNNNFNDINNNHVYALPMSAIDELGSLRSNNDIPTKTSSDSLRINIANKNNTNINNTNITTNINNNDINNNNSISTITSLEDKLNGLTLKLSKLNESINNNKKKLSSYSNIDQFNIYNNIDIKKDSKDNDTNSPFTNIGLGNTVLNNINNINEKEDNDMNMQIHSGLNNYLGLKQTDNNYNYNYNFEDNKLLNNNNLNNENDEDYLGEEQINL